MEVEVFSGMEVEAADRGVGWLSGLEAAGWEEEENGSMEGALGELLTGAEATAVNLSLRLAFTEDTGAGKEGFIPVFGALGIGVLSRVGLKPDNPKEKEAADETMGGVAGVGAREALEGGGKEKGAAPEPSVARGLSEPLAYGEGSPGMGAGDFKDEDTKENTAGAPPAQGRGKVATGAARDTGAREAGALAAEGSSFCGA